MSASDGDVVIQTATPSEEGRRRGGRKEEGREGGGGRKDGVKVNPTFR